MKKVHIHCHKPLDDNPRGGEISVRIIRDYLKEFFDVSTTLRGEAIPEADIVLTWGLAADETLKHHNKTGTPYILMVRFWRNVQPLPVGDLMNDPIDEEFRKSKQELFDKAHCVVTNNYYSRDVLKRIYNAEAIVSYVPVLGKVKYGNVVFDKDYLTIITPEIYGEKELATGLADRGYNILVVNCKKDNPDFQHENITIVEYVDDLHEIWQRTKILLLPTYDHDICGTRRISIEAMRYGVPVLATDRCGISERIPNLIPMNDALSWVLGVEKILSNWNDYSWKAYQVFNNYNTDYQLSIFKREIKRL